VDAFRNQQLIPPFVLPPKPVLSCVEGPALSRANGVIERVTPSDCSELKRKHPPKTKRSPSWNNGYEKYPTVLAEKNMFLMLIKNAQIQDARIPESAVATNKERLLARP